MAHVQLAVGIRWAIVQHKRRRRGSGVRLPRKVLVREAWHEPMLGERQVGVQCKLGAWQV